jgi:hypothetical protein
VRDARETCASLSIVLYLCVYVRIGLLQGGLLCRVPWGAYADAEESSVEEQQASSRRQEREAWKRLRPN